MKFIALLFFAFLWQTSIAQIGVGTETPLTDLHINGNLQITHSLHVGGSANSLGNAGLENQILLSNGSDQSMEWDFKDEIPYIPKIVGIIENLNETIYFSGNTVHTILFDSFPKLDEELISYNSSSGELTILEAGYYKLSVSLTLSHIDNPAGDTAGGFRSSVVKNDSEVILANYTTHGERSNSNDHLFTGTEYLNVGDVIKLNVSYTQQFKVVLSKLSLIKLL